LEIYRNDIQAKSRKVFKEVFGVLPQHMMRKINRTKNLLSLSFTALLFLISAFVLISLQLVAQDNSRFRHYDTSDGLASDAAGIVLQDSLGFIWIHHDHGASRFDGYGFKVYQFDPNDSTNSIGSGRTTGMFKDPSGNIWLYFFKGGNSDTPIRHFLKYDRSKDRFVRYKVEFKSPSFNPTFDKNDSTLWLTGSGREGSGLFKFNYKLGQSLTILNSGGDSIHSFSRNSLWGAKDLGKYLIVGSDAGLWKFDKKTNKFSRPDCSPTDSAFLYNSRIRVRPDITSYDGGIWCAMNDSNDLTIAILHLNERLSIDSRFNIPATYQAIDVGKDGSLWVATSNDGLYQYHPNGEPATHISSNSSDPYSLHSNSLSDVMVDKNQNVWISTREHGLSVLVKRDLTFHNYRIELFSSVATYNSNNEDFIVTARTYTWPPDDYSVNELFYSPLPKDAVNAITFKPIKLDEPIIGSIVTMTKGKNHFWVTASAKIWGFPLDTTSGKILSGPLKTFPFGEGDLVGGAFPLWEDPKGNLWVGTARDGLNKINAGVVYGSKGSVEKYVNPSDLNSPLPEFIPNGPQSFLVRSFSDRIDLFHDGQFEAIFSMGVPNTVYKSRLGTTYIGTADGLYVNQGKDIKYVFKKDDIIKRSVLKIQEDELGRLWLSNLDGITCYDRAEKIELIFN